MPEDVSSQVVRHLVQRPDYRNNGKYQFVVGYTGGGAEECVHLTTEEIFERLRGKRGQGKLVDDGTDLWWEVSMESLEEQIVQRCGHVRVFIPKGDGHDDARRKRYKEKSCPPCGLLKNQEDNRISAMASQKPVKKGTEVKLLPLGTVITLRLDSDGWHGWLSGDGTEVETAGGGLMGQLSKLARKWLQAGGRKLHGKV